MVRMGRAPPRASARRKEQEAAENAAVGAERDGTSKTKISTSDGGNEAKDPRVLHVGRVYPNLIESVYEPAVLARCERAAEDHAGWLVWREEKDVVVSDDDDETKENDANDTFVDVPSLDDMSSHDGASVLHLFSSSEAVDELREQVLAPTVRDFSGAAYRVRANAAKFERSLDERYGRARPLLTHPLAARLLRAARRRAAVAELGRLTRSGDPPLAASTSVILLFMCYRQGVRRDGLALAALFLLVGLRPWVLVAAVVAARWWFESRRRAPVKGGSGVANAEVTSYWEEDERRGDRYASLRTPVGESFESVPPKDLDDRHDVIVVGTGVGALYCASTLSRIGRRVLVLDPSDDASGNTSSDERRALWSETYTTNAPEIPFDVTDHSRVTLVSKQQRLLAPALATTTDAQGGVRFAVVGGPADGHAHSVLSVPSLPEPFVVRPDPGLREDAAALFGWWDGDDADNAVHAYVQGAAAVNADAGAFYVAKVTPVGTCSSAPPANNAYSGAGARRASDFLARWVPDRPDARALCAALGSAAAENLSPSETSMAAHASALAALKEPCVYPVGGHRSLARALERVVVAGGGRVVRNAPVRELLFDDDDDGPNHKDDKKKKTAAPACRGVRLASGADVRTIDAPSSAVVVASGFVDAFVRLMPDAVRTKHGVPGDLPSLRERRPLLRLLLLLDGTAASLELPAADWWRVPSATDDATTASSSDDGAGETKNNDDETKDTPPPPPKPVKFTTGRSWMRVSFPSAKDPGWETVHGAVRSTCVVTFEADDDFVRHFHTTKPSVFVPSRNTTAPTRSGSAEATRLAERVLKDVYREFPQLKDHVAHAELRGPYRKGLSHTPERYAARTIVPRTLYPRLFVSGTDLCLDSFAGDIVGSWLAANAVVGYSRFETTALGRNLTTDLCRLLDEPRGEDEAVLLETRDDENPTATTTNKTKEDEDAPAVAAEASKES